MYLNDRLFYKSCMFFQLLEEEKENPLSFIPSISRPITYITAYCNTNYSVSNNVVRGFAFFYPCLLCAVEREENHDENHVAFLNIPVPSRACNLLRVI